ncbi:MAG: glycosyltransferase [Sumerlaeia bacterium]
MILILALALAAHVALWFGFLLWKFRVHTGSTPRLPQPKAPPESLPRLAAFVPARNEEAAIEAAVRSLLDQDYPNLTVVVANDNSTDRTGEILARIARDYPADRLTVIEPPEPPPGWMGKCHALWNAVKGAPADAELFLFCDADVIHNPHTLRRAVELMRERDAGMVALLPRLDNVSFWEHVVMPTTMHLGGVALDPRKVMDPDEPDILGIGAFSIVKRSVYESWGGHEAIKGEVVDDVAMAMMTKVHRAKLVLAHGWDAVHLRMYDGLNSIVRGFEKNSHITVGGGFARAIYVSFVIQFLHWIPLLVAIIAAATGHWGMAGAGVLVHLVTGLEVVRRMRKAMKVNALYLMLFHPLAMVVNAVILIRSSYYGNVKGVVNWRGRQLAKPQQRVRMFGRLEKVQHVETAPDPDSATPPQEAKAS